MGIRSKPKANNQEDPNSILKVIFMEANGFDDSFGYIWGYFNTESTTLFL